MYVDDNALNAKKTTKIITIKGNYVEPFIHIQLTRIRNSNNWILKYFKSVIPKDGSIDPEIAKVRQKTENLYYAINKTLLTTKDKKIRHHSCSDSTICMWVLGNTKKACIEMRCLRRIPRKTKLTK